MLKNNLINRTNIDLKDKWRNVIVKDAKGQFTLNELSKLYGPNNWSDKNSRLFNFINKSKSKSKVCKIKQFFTWKSKDWKQIKLKKVSNISRMGEMELITRFRCYLNKL